MFFNSIFTLAVFFIKTYSTLAADQSKNVTTIFVDGKNGSDNSSCGQRVSPCMTVRFAIEKVSLENTTSSIVNLFPGMYKAESVKIDCGSHPLKELRLQGLGNNTSEKVQVTLSVDIIKCNIIFSNIQWKSMSPSPVLINLLVASVSLINSSVTDLSFSIIALGSNIVLQRSTITNCVGLQPLIPLVSATGLVGFTSHMSLIMSVFYLNNAQLISTKEITTFHVENSQFISNNLTADQPLLLIDITPTLIEDSQFINNSGSVIEMSHSTMANITWSVFRNNAVMSGSVLVVGKHVVLNVVGCSFASNYGNSKGPVVKKTELKITSVITVQNSYFSCNKVNSSIHLPPIHSHTLNNVSCTNCTTNPQCPVYCLTGSFLLDSTMCSLCPKGTYGLPIVHNITTITCDKCIPGYYSSNPGSDACKPCAKGTFAAKSGSTQCSPCKNDFMTSGKGESSCATMTIGCVVLTVFIILLILIPVLILVWEHLHNTSKKIGLQNKQTDFKRICEHTSDSIQ